MQFLFYYTIIGKWRSLGLTYGSYILNYKLQLTTPTTPWFPQVPINKQQLGGHQGDVALYHTRPRSLLLIVDFITVDTILEK